MADYSGKLTVRNNKTHREETSEFSGDAVMLMTDEGIFIVGKRDPNKILTLVEAGLETWVDHSFDYDSDVVMVTILSEMVSHFMSDSVPEKVREAFSKLNDAIGDHIIDEVMTDETRSEMSEECKRKLSELSKEELSFLGEMLEKVMQEK